MKKLLFVASALAALSLLTPSSGFAQHVYGNQIGVYFDMDATVTDFQTSGAQFDTYLIMSTSVIRMTRRRDSNTSWVWPFR